MTLRILAWGIGLMVKTSEVRQGTQEKQVHGAIFPFLLSETYLGEALVTPERGVWKMALAVPDATSSKQYYSYGTKDNQVKQGPQIDWRQEMCWQEINSSGMMS